MIQIINTRLTIENPITHEKYHPRVISASTQQDYPFAVSAATIDVVANVPPNSSGYAAPIHFDDIVRLQVSCRFKKEEEIVWQDIFHGRIENLSSPFGTSNQLQLYCVGHEAELRKDLIEETKAYTTATDAKVLLAYFSKYFSRLVYSDSLVSAGVIFPTCDTTKDQTFLTELISDMEKNSGYDWAFSVVPTYDSSKNLDKVYAQWKQFTTDPVKSYSIKEGTWRVISADFEQEGEDVVTTQKIYGYTNTAVTPNVQYSGSYTDSASETRYGKRSAVDTYDWIKSNDLCTTIAQGVQQGIKLPVISGQATLIGTPEVHIGDYVPIKLKSLELNGASIEMYLHVFRLQHTIIQNQYHTIVDLGKVKKVAEDYIAQVAKTVKVTKCSLVKG